MPVPIADENPTRDGHKSPITIILIVLNLLVYFFYQIDYSEFFSGETYGEPDFDGLMGFGLIPVVFWGDRPLIADLIIIPSEYTILTYMFMHSSLMHIISNLLILWIFGDNIEQALGRYTYLAFYIIGGIVAGLLHAYMMPYSAIPMIGASGAVAAVGAAYLLLHPTAKLWILVFFIVPVKLPAWVAIVAWIAFQIYALTDPEGGEVAWWAHIGGFGFGILFILLFKRQLISSTYANLFKKTEA